MQTWTLLPRVLGIAALLAATVSAAAGRDCSLALVLAMDASKSMNTADFDMAFKGTAAALKNDAVRSAILAQPLPVALVVFEWSGRKHQKIVHGWSLLRSRQDIDAVAKSLEEHQRGGIGQKTGTGTALRFAYALLKDGPDCNRMVVDVASDGYNSDGLTPREFYASGADTNVTVNALVVGGEIRPHLWAFFKDEVLRGPGAFSLATIGFQDYAKVMEEKLLRELEAPRLSGILERTVRSLCPYERGPGTCRPTISAIVAARAGTESSPDVDAAMANLDP